MLLTSSRFSNFRCLLRYAPGGSQATLMAVRSCPDLRSWQQAGQHVKRCALLSAGRKRKLLPQKKAAFQELDGPAEGGRGAVLEDLPLNALATPVAWHARRSARLR